MAAVSACDTQNEATLANLTFETSGMFLIIHSGLSLVRPSHWSLVDLNVFRNSAGTSRPSGQNAPVEVSATIVKPSTSLGLIPASSKALWIANHDHAPQRWCVSHTSGRDPSAVLP